VPENRDGTRDGSGRFKSGASGNPKGRPRKDAASGVTAQTTTVEAFTDKRTDAIRAARNDGWVNSSTGYGTSRDKRIGTYFSSCPVTPQEAEELWQGDDLAASMVETWPNEMLREGFELCIVDDDVDGQADEDYEDRRPGQALDRARARRDRARRDRRARRRDEASGDEAVEKITQAWEELGLTETLWQAIAYERGYGGGAILIGANDGKGDLTQPLDAERISAVHYLLALEPRECIPLKWYTDPLAPKFGKPETYLLNPHSIGLPSSSPKGGLALTEVHESRLAIFPGIRVSRIARTSSYYGWGDSIFTRALPVLRDFNSALAAAGVLMHDFAQGVFKVKDLFGMMSTNPGLIEERFRIVDEARSTLRSVVVDAEGEDFQRVTTPVSGLPELLDRFMVRLAAAAGMPVTLLMGQSPKGLGNEGESDIRFFYDRVAAMQRRKLAPVVRHITRIIMRALGVEPEKWVINFKPLWQPTEKETAEARNVQMQTDTGYIQNGVLTDRQVREARFGGAEYSYETHVDMDEEDELLTGEIPADIRDPNGELAPTDPADPNAPAPVAGVTPAETAMNGAQVTSLLDVVARVGLGEISRPSGIGILRIAFRLSVEEANEVLGPEDFKPTKPEPPPSPFGGGKPPAGAPEDEKPSEPPVEKKPAPEVKEEPEAPSDDA